MRKFMMLIGAAAMAATMPAMAEAQGKGKGGAKAKTSVGATMKGQGSAARTRAAVRANAKADARASARAAHTTARTQARMSGQSDSNRNGILDIYERDSDGDGIPDYRDVTGGVDANGNGIIDQFESGRRTAGACPPGLAKKTPACIPPGQAKKMFQQNQRLPDGYNQFTDYNAIPLEYRTHYGLDDDFRYIYGNDTIYVIDPATRLITRVIDLIF